MGVGVAITRRRAFEELQNEGLGVMGSMVLRWECRNWGFKLGMVQGLNLKGLISIFVAIVKICVQFRYALSSSWN